MFHLFCPRLQSWTDCPLLLTKDMMKARRSKNTPFWLHRNGGCGRDAPDLPLILSKIAILDRLSPFTHQGNDEGAKEQKRTILASLKWGGGRDAPDVLFILSKIVVSLHADTLRPCHPFLWPRKTREEL